MSDAVITMTGNFAALLSEYDKLNAKQGKTDQLNMRLKKSAREAGDASSKLTTGTKQALDQATTATEKYRQTLAQLRAMLDSGRITEEKYAASRRAAQATFKATDPASIEKAKAASQAIAEADRAAAKAQEERNQTMRRGEQVTLKLATAEDRHAREVAELNDLYRKGAIDSATYQRGMAAADEQLKESTRDTKALAEAERAEAKAQAAANEITKNNRTARERHAEAVLAAKRAYDQGRISLATYTRELQRQDELIRPAPSNFARWTASIFTAQAAYGALRGAIQGVIEHQRQMLDQAAEVGRRFDDNLRKWQVLSGQNELQSAESQRGILNVARRVGSTSEEAQLAANQLVSAGFSPADAAGGALESVLMTQRATGGEAPTDQLARGMASFLASQGLDKNTQNMQMLSVGLTGIANATQIKLSQFPDFAKEAATFKGKLSIPEQLAAGAALQEVGMGGSEAATSLRSLVVRGGTADTDKKQAALARMGLKKEDIDFIGENLDTVLGRLDTGLASVKETDRETILKTLFEEQAIAPIKQLIQDRAKIQNLQGEFANVAGFNAAVERGTGGVIAAENRLKIAGELNKLGQFGTAEAARQQAVKNRFDQLPAGGMQQATAQAAGIIVDNLTGGRVSRDTTESFFGTDEFSFFSGLGVGSPRDRVRRGLAEGGVIQPQGATATAERAMQGLKEAIDKNTEATLRAAAVAPAAAVQAPLQPLINARGPEMGGRTE